MKPLKDILSEALQVTDNPNFWKWFGNSKVVDAQGNPLVVYHTSVADVSQFKRIKDIGMHFGTQGQAADRYHLKINKDPYGPELRGTKHNTMAVYLRITNPLRLEDAGDWGDVKSVLRELRRVGLIGQSEFDLLRLKNILSVKSFIVSKGYDGIVYANVGESTNGDTYRKAVDAAFRDMINAAENPDLPDDEKKKFASVYADAHAAHQNFKRANPEDSWIVFDPKQIKSAIGNNGNFDPKDPDITH